MNIIESLNWRYATKKFDSNRKLSKNQVNTLKNDKILLENTLPGWYTPSI